MVGKQRASAALVLAVASAFVGVFNAWAAEPAPVVTTGSLEIHVSDRASGRPLPNVMVEVSGAAPVTTDANGVARITGLRAPGSYDILLRAEGYVTLSVKDVAVPESGSRMVPIALWPPVEESVEVIAKAKSVSLEEVAPVTRFSGDFLEELPVYGRDVQAMLTLAPGIQDADGDGNPNVHGARERDFKLMIGDVSNQDPLTGLYLGYINPDTIADLEVIPVGAGVEYGRAQGGFARVVQKQGSNLFEGIVGFAFQSSRLDGNGAASTPSEKIPSFKTMLPFFQITGPIIQDRLWYRLSTEYRWEDEPQAHGGNIAVTGHRQLIADGEVTWQMTPQTKMALHLRNDPFTDTNVGLSGAVPSESARRLEFDGMTYALSTTSTLSSRLLVESTAAVQDYQERTTPMVQGVGNECVHGYAFIEAAQCFNESTGRYSGSYNEDRTDTRRRLTLSGKMTYYGAKFLGATHVIRAGAGVEDEQFTRLTESRPFLNFQIIYPTFVDVRPDGTVYVPPPYGLASTSIALPIRSERSASGTTTTLWVEDQFRPRSNLSVTLGLRYDLEHISAVGFEPFDPIEENRRWKEIATDDPQTNAGLIQPIFTRYEGVEAIPYLLEPLAGFAPGLSASAQQTLNFTKTRRPSNIELSNGVIAPRLSVSWDPFADGKTKIALSAGRYYDKTFLAVPLVETDPVTVSLVYTALQFFTDQWYIVDFSGTVNPGVSMRQVDRGLRPPYQDELALTLEREIAPEVVIRLVGIAREFKDQFQDIDLNRAPGDEGRCAIQRRPEEPYIVASPGSGFEVTDVYTGGTYVDTDPGNGDGRIDDCAGQSVFRQYGRFGSGLFPYADGRPDLYLQNPAWGSVLRVGNYNRSRYHAIVLELIRRQRGNWQMEASYTWSRAIGEAEDFLQTLGNDRSIVDDERGFLSYDQRHVVKVNATVSTPHDIRLGTAVSWQSGLPFSVIHQTASYDSITPALRGLNPPDPSLRTVYDDNGRNTQRNRPYWNVDVQASKELRTGRGNNIRLTAEIFNLLNDDTYIVYTPALKYGQRFSGENDAYNRFGRRYQLGIRVAF